MGDCAVCTHDFCLTSRVYATPCGHVFHGSCLDEWLQHSPQCPCCKASVQLGASIRLYHTWQPIPVELAQLHEQYISTQTKLDTTLTKLNRYKKLAKVQLKRLNEHSDTLQTTKEELRSVTRELKDLQVQLHHYKSKSSAYKDRLKHHAMEHKLLSTDDATHRPYFISLPSDKKWDMLVHMRAQLVQESTVLKETLSQREQRIEALESERTEREARIRQLEHANANLLQRR